MAQCVCGKTKAEDGSCDGSQKKCKKGKKKEN